MSLRVLLADESTTIKKVFELGLQDYGIEIKNVNNGLDVLSVCQSFLPDIIFIDILLQKKNGYQVCADLKKTPKLSTIPVVMMWSSFMELDQSKYVECHADEKLEKPFDVDHLRTLIKKHVNKTDDQHISSLLSFSPSITKDFLGEESNKLKSPDIWKKRAEEELNFESQFNEDELAVLNEDGDLLDSDAGTKIDEWSAQDPDHGLTFQSNDDSDLPSLDLNDDPHEVSEPEIDNLHFQKPEPQNPKESWKEKTLSKFKVEIPSDNIEDNFTSVRLENLNPSPTQNYVPEVKPSTKSPPVAPTTRPQSVDLKSPEIDSLIKAHIESVVKMSIHKILPDLVEKIVKEELNRLLEDELQDEMESP